MKSLDFKLTPQLASSLGALPGIILESGADAGLERGGSPEKGSQSEEPEPAPGACPRHAAAAPVTTLKFS